MDSELMTVKEIRLHNARLLQDTLPGGQDEMCALLKKGQSQVSSFMGKNPQKNIGDKIAKQIEEAFNKPKGWLDTYHKSAKEIASGGGTLIRIEQTVQEPAGNYATGINNKQLLHALLKAKKVRENAELLANDEFDYVDLATLATVFYEEYSHLSGEALDEAIEKLKEKHRKHDIKTG